MIIKLFLSVLSILFSILMIYITNINSNRFHTNMNSNRLHTLNLYTINPPYGDKSEGFICIFIYEIIHVIYTLIL